MSSWEAVDLETSTSWLEPAIADGFGTGLDPAGWEANIWIAHAMYELPDIDVGYTHEDAHQALLAADVVEPTVIGSVNLDETTIVTGGGLGFSERPSSAWIRLSWRALADRLGVVLLAGSPPSFSWFPYRSWPAAITPPGEGSLDAESLDALVPHLAAAAPARTCVAFYDAVPTMGDPATDRCFAGNIDELRALVDPGDGRAATPSNFWPSDRSWFVYTDWDLWATKVSGPQELIDQIVADPKLETLQWTETICPVCGYDLETPPWTGRSPSDQICPCCRTQFGYDDAIGLTKLHRLHRRHIELREQWIEGGSKWWSSSTEPPIGWTASGQLHRVTRH